MTAVTSRGSTRPRECLGQQRTRQNKHRFFPSRQRIIPHPPGRRASIRLTAGLTAILVGCLAQRFGGPRLDPTARLEPHSSGAHDLRSLIAAPDPPRLLGPSFGPTSSSSREPVPCPFTATARFNSLLVPAKSTAAQPCRSGACRHPTTADVRRPHIRFGSERSLQSCSRVDAAGSLDSQTRSCRVGHVCRLRPLRSRSLPITSNCTSVSGHAWEGRLSSALSIMHVEPHAHP